MFYDALEHRCRLTPEPYQNGTWPIDPEIQTLCGNWDCPEDRYCGSPSDYGLQYDIENNDVASLNFGYTKYENIFWSLFSVILIMTTTGWSSAVFIFQRYQNETIVTLYFVSLMLLTAFILVNMMMGALQDGFLQREAEVKEGII